MKSPLIGVLISVVCFFAIGFMLGRMSQAPSIASFFGGNSTRTNLELFWDVWDTLQLEYVDGSKVNEKELYYGAIKGLVQSLGDPATTYLDPEETSEFNKSIEGKAFEGIGAELSYEAGRIVIVSPLKGSPASKAGLKPGDVILKVDGKEISSTDTIFDVVGRIRGKAGTDVNLTVLHKSEIKPVDITITRGEIDVPSMELVNHSENSEVKILRVSRFTDESVKVWENNWDRVVKEVVASKAKGLILDLRGNPGGYFDSAIYAGNEFLPKGTVLSKQSDKDGKEEVFRVTREGKLKDIPLVILVDEGSASASEILAGALQQNKRAQVVGVNTYGKGTAQTVMTYPDGSSLHLTILKWLLPDGQWLNRDNPIKPDIVQEYPEEEFKKGNDVQLNKAFGLLKDRI